MKEYEIIVDIDGNYEVKSLGIKGTSCVEATHKVVQTIGGKIIDEKKTQEYYDKAPKATITGGRA